jgi:hypothetical protein
MPWRMSAMPWTALTSSRADPQSLECLLPDTASRRPPRRTHSYMPRQRDPELHANWAGAIATGVARLATLGQIGDNTVVPLAGNPLLVHGTCASGAWNLCIRIPVAGTRRRIHCWVLTIGWQSTSGSSHHPFNEVRQNNTFCSHERSDSVWSVAPANAHAAVVLDLAMGAAVAQGSQVNVQ